MCVSLLLIVLSNVFLAVSIRTKAEIVLKEGGCYNGINNL